MSNNIIDTVTQAVNSLVSALKLPDESAKANDTLGSMNFPSSAVFCPIRIMIPRPVCLLITKPSVLCLRRVLYPVRIKVSSPHWSIYCAANFPKGVPVSFHLVSSKLVGNDIDYGLREFRWSGKQAKKFNAITRGLLPPGSGDEVPPASLIWICPSRCVTTACTSPAAYPGRRTPPRKLSRWRTR